MVSPVLTKVLSETLVGIYRFHLQYGVMPSVRDLKTVLQKSHGAVQHRRDKLEAQGYIAWLSGKSRSITITDKGMAHLRAIGAYQPPEPSILAINRLPLLGEIAAGYLSEPARNDAFVEVETFDAKHHFTLTVSGDSMIGVGIIDRATAVFKRVPDGYEPKPGQIVAAYVEGFGTTLKRFYRDGLKVVLEAANPHYPPQQIDTSQTFVRIDGVWTGVTIAAGG
jgi:repressor LexA